MSMPKAWAIAICAIALFAACKDEDAGSPKDTSQGGVDVPTGSDTTLPDITGITDVTLPDSSAADTGGPDIQMVDTTVADTAAADAADDDVGAPVVCGTATPEALAACVDASAMMADLAWVEGARTAKSNKATEVRELAEARLKELGYTVEVHDYGPGANVIATLPGAVEPDEVVMISAHYDSVPDCSGADDNGSGVVGVLEAARVLATGTHDRTLQVALWDEEERGKLGSTAWVSMRAKAGQAYVVSFVFEMIGYYSDVKNSQTFPQGFGFLFPDAEQAMIANDWRGDFIAVLAGDNTLVWVDAMEEHAGKNDHRIVSVILNESLRKSPLLADLRRSDHAPFWQVDYPAINLTDTANFRNPYYHCAAGDDVAQWIDDVKMGKTVAATVYAASLALRQDGPKGVAGKTPICDVVKQDCPDNKKCALIFEGNVFFEPKCVTPYEGSVGAGQSCTRPTNVAGDDTCQAGLFCTFWGGIAEKSPVERWCLGYCQEDADCGPDEVCTGVGATAHGNGVCLKRCDPWGSACPNETNCTAERRGSDHHLRFGCFFTGSVNEGGACEIAFDECATGLNCAFHPDSGIEQCRKPCDDTHPCDGGQQCLAVANPPPGMPSLGFCWSN